MSVTFESKRGDLKFAEAYAMKSGEQPVRVACADCGSRVYFMKDQDRPKDLYYCVNSSSLRATSHFRATRHEVERMPPASFKSMVKSQYMKEDAERPVKLIVDTDGVKAFTKTRPFNDDELADYYRGALEHERKKIEAEVL